VSVAYPDHTFGGWRSTSLHLFKYVRFSATIVGFTQKWLRLKG